MEGDYEPYPNEEKLLNYTRGGQSVWPLTAAIVITLTVHYGFKDELKQFRGQLASYFTGEAKAANKVPALADKKDKDGMSQLVYPSHGLR